MNIDRILKSPRIMSAMTGTTPQAFLDLLPTFSKAWETFKEEEHEKRQCVRAIGGGRKGFLKTGKE
jgi:hypothetical protein